MAAHGASAAVAPTALGVRPAWGFPRTFWIVNLMELFERGAYHGMNAILAVYLTRSVAGGGLGFGEQAVGLLQGLIYATTYIVPIIGGALADRYGYRRILLVAFSLLAAGYFAAGQVSVYGLVFLSLLIMATGSGLFKPIVTGTIARVSDDRNSAIGFGIYYWMINLGVFLGPLAVTVIKGFAWHYVFAASAAYTGLMLLPTIFAFSEPPKPANTKKVKDVLVGAAEVLADARFMLMVVIYAGFWIMHFQHFGALLWYLRDLVDRAPVSDAMTALFAALGLPWRFQLDSEHVSVINGGSIILLQFLVSRTVKNWPPLGTIATGMTIGAVGYLCFAVSQNSWVFVIGMAVASIGEMTAHPKYFSLVGLVAPADRTAVYMGYAFLYGVFGSLIGSNLGAFFYARIVMTALGTPAAGARAALFWLLFVGLDLIAALGLVAFARWFGRDTPVTRRRAKGIMRGLYGMIGLLGGFLLYVTLSRGTVEYGTVVQAAMFLIMGATGLFMLGRGTATRDALPRPEPPDASSRSGRPSIPTSS